MRGVVIPSEVAMVAAGQHGLLSARQCELFGIAAHQRGLLVRHGLWARVWRGVYDTTPDAPRPFSLHHARAAVAGLLAYGDDAVAVGPSALALMGVQGLPLQIAPQVALAGGRSARSQPGVRLRQFDAGMQVIAVGQYLAAAPEWALAQTVPELQRNAAVSIMDSCRHLRLLDEAGLAYAHDLARGRRGVERTHGWWDLSRALAESPLETRCRLDCVDCGVPPEELQVHIRDADGVLLGRGDMGWKQRGGRWLIAEADGREPHELPQALLHDRRRQNAFQLAGADVLRFTWADTQVRRHIGTTVRRFLAG